MTTPPTGGPVSLVTGADKGIGMETVRRLVGSGHRVYLSARDAGLTTLALPSPCNSARMTSPRKVPNR